jgi:ATP-dependent helicase/nuclease subunit A
MYMEKHSTQWTQKQLETIELRQKNILVSAAAGSGKTAVLIERIKQLILSDGVPVNQLLVVTFTKAAASEMKEKLVRSLNQAVRENPGQTGFLRAQLELIPRSNISTFHSFALEVIRRYFHLIDLDPGFKVCDEAEAKIMKADGMDQVFEDFFERNDPDFLDYVRCYASPKNETELKKNLISLYDKLRSLPDSFDWLENAILQLNQNEEQFLSSDLMKFVKQYTLEKLSAALFSMDRALQLLDSHEIAGAAAVCRQDMEAIEQMRQALINDSFDETRHLIATFKPGTMLATKSQKEDYALIKEHVKGFRDRAKDIIRKELQPKFFTNSIINSTEDMNQTYEKGKTLYRILVSFEQAYNAMKRDKSFLDFSDIEHFAIEILRNAEAAQEYREKFQYIFIDEYQDSNLLQETIIDCIKRENNVFMVGDIKQSIYKFRLAEPEIFQKKYISYKDPESTNSTKIDLNRNFRSKETVIRAVNGVFGHLMEYDRDAALYRGIPDSQFPDKPVELVIINGTGELSEEHSFADDNIEELKTTELEAMAAAQIIKKALGTPFYDAKAGKIRPLSKRDVVILMHGVKRRAEIFYQALQEVEVDSYIDDHSGYFDTLEIMNFSDLLKVIDNDKRDVPLLGVLRSPIFNYSVDDLIEIRSQSRENTFHGAFRSYGNCGKNVELKKRTRQALSKIVQWKKESRYMPIDEFVWKLMRDTGYYAYVGALQGGTLRQANLRIFVERAKVFRSSGDGSIYGLLRYMSSLAEKEIETGQASIVGENDDIIRIMTIHKSKGLEFPFVLVASLGSRFIYDKMDKTGVMHKDLGLGLTRFNPKEKWYRHTLMQQAIIAKKRKEELEEAVRVLYVAFTRAMDQLVLLGSVSDWEKNELKFESGAKAESNYLGMIYPYADEAGISIRIINRDQLQQKTKERMEHSSSVKQMMDTAIIGDSEVQRESVFKEIIGNRLSYHYPNEQEKHKKSKYSVSEINSRYSLDTAIKKPEFLIEKQGFTPAETGIIMHRVMEHIDPKRFHQPEYIKEYLEQLVKSELLLPIEAETVNLSWILTLAKGELGQRMAKADVLHREKAFNLLHSYEDAEVMVQGVIDCWFEEDEKIVLIDYKTGKDGWNIDDRYKEQLRLYKKALEIIQAKPVLDTYLYLFSEGKVLKVDID